VTVPVGDGDGAEDDIPARIRVFELARQPSRRYDGVGTCSALAVRRSAARQAGSNVSSSCVGTTTPAAMIALGLADHTRPVA
jgi:hypothetical protein